jgi:hypothetical protein
MFAAGTESRVQSIRHHGPEPGQPITPVVLVEDSGPMHISKLSLAALAARAQRLTVEWLPEYAPTLALVSPKIPAWV